MANKAAETNSALHVLTAHAADSIVPESEFHKHTTILPGTTTLKPNKKGEQKVPASVTIPNKDSAGHGKILLLKVAGKGTPETIRDGIVRMLALLYRWSVSEDRSKKPTGRPKDEEIARGERALRESLDALGWTEKDFKREANILIAQAAENQQKQTLIKASGKITIGNTTYIVSFKVPAKSVVGAAEDADAAFLVPGAVYTVNDLTVDPKDVKALKDAEADTAHTIEQAKQALSN